MTNTDVPKRIDDLLICENSIRRNETLKLDVLRQWFVVVLRPGKSIKAQTCSSVPSAIARIFPVASVIIF